jgi:hypothetical protein
MCKSCYRERYASVHPPCPIPSSARVNPLGRAIDVQPLTEGSSRPARVHLFGPRKGGAPKFELDDTALPEWCELPTSGVGCSGGGGIQWESHPVPGCGEREPL